MPDLRVGIVVYDDRIYAWQAQAIEQIRAVAGAPIAAFLAIPHDRDSAFAFPRRATAFRRIDAALTAPRFAGGRDMPPLDIVINLTRGPAPCEVGACIWQLQFADPKRPGHFESHDGSDVSLVWLRQSSLRIETNIGQVCLKATASPRRNCDRVMLESTFLFARALRARRMGATTALAVPEPPAKRLSWPGRVARQVARGLDKRLSRTRWVIGFATQNVETIIRARALPPLTWLCGLPADRFFADPFPLPGSGDTLSMLAENGDMAPPHKGHLSEIAFRKSGEVISVSDALVAPEHFSFPFLLDDAGDQYCIPECYQSGELRAFRRVDGAWRPDAILLGDVPATDPVLYFHDQTWWLFCCDRRHDDTTHLYLHFADNWRGPFTSHPLNPVKSDVRGSRPAGAIAEVDGDLYRPAQDCSRRYGGALSVQRITTLTKTDYAEETAFALSPEMLGPGFAGLHTFNGGSDITVIDALEKRSVLRFWKGSTSEEPRRRHSVGSAGADHSLVGVAASNLNRVNSSSHHHFERDAVQ